MKMNKLLSVILVCVMVSSLFIMTACGNSKDSEGENTGDSVDVTQELSEKQQAELDFILENTTGVLPLYTKYEYKGDVEVDGYNCCRFEFYSDDMYLGAVAKAYDEEVMFWDAADGKYMYMVNDNGWYVTGNYVDAPETAGQADGAQTNVLNDGISGQYTNNLGSFYITLYDDDYAGDADGYFRAAGIVQDDNGQSKQYSIAGEFYYSDESGSIAYMEDSSGGEGSLEYTEIYVYENTNGDNIQFAFGEESVYISDNGTHNGEKYNLTGMYLLDFYY